MNSVDIFLTIGLAACMMAIVYLYVRVSNQEFDIGDLRKDRDKLVRRAIEADVKKAMKKARRANNREQ